MKNLKNIFYCLLIGILSTACGSDDEGTSISLEGTVWVETSFSSTGCDDADDNESGTATCTANNCSTILLSDGTFTTTEIDDGVTETTSGTYSISGNIITITISEGGASFTIEVTYSISGSTLSISFEEPGSGCMNSGTYEAQS